jgi:hypothetical protein
MGDKLAGASSSSKVNAAQQLGADPVGNGVEGLAAIIRRLDVDAKRAFSARCVDSGDEHVSPGRFPGRHP